MVRHDIYIYIYIYISCRTISADIHDPLSPPLSIVHWFRQIFRTTSRIGTELLYVRSSWSSCLCSSMWRGPQEYITYEFVLLQQCPACLVCIYIYIYIYIYKHVWLKTVECFLFKIFKWRRSSLLIIFRMSGWKWWRKWPILAQALSTISLVVFEGCIKLFVAVSFYISLQFFFFFFEMVESARTSIGHLVYHKYTNANNNFVYLPASRFPKPSLIRRNTERERQIDRQRELTKTIRDKTRQALT